TSKYPATSSRQNRSTVRDTFPTFRSSRNDLISDWIAAGLRAIKSQPISENIAIGSRFDMASEAIFEIRPVEGLLLELLFRIRERLQFEHNSGDEGAVRAYDE